MSNKALGIFLRIFSGGFPIKNESGKSADFRSFRSFSSFFFYVFRSFRLSRLFLADFRFLFLIGLRMVLYKAGILQAGSLIQFRTSSLIFQGQVLKPYTFLIRLLSIFHMFQVNFEGKLK
jgi:hypothetical protein